MPDQLPLLPDSPPPPENPDAITLARYAERAYLEYALSVVKGRALPDVCDGAKEERVFKRPFSFPMAPRSLLPTRVSRSLKVAEDR